MAPERHLPNEAFYFPVLVGIELLARRRKDDCGRTLGIKINLIFIEKNNLPMSIGKNVIGTFWLREIQ